MICIDKYNIDNNGKNELKDDKFNLLFRDIHAFGKSN